MSDEELESFRALIETRLKALAADDRLGASGQATVTLDQQAVGRLTRMDALQNQAMAQATGARRAVERQRLIAALGRLDDGEFGFCDVCGDDIALGRLELDPAANRCIDCANS